jgi:predicted transcriptional regulator
MSPKLSVEQREAIRREGSPIFVEDDETKQVYVLVETPTYERAIEALESQRSHEAIREGIADMEAGRVAPLEEVCARIRAKLQLPDVA